MLSLRNHTSHITHSHTHTHTIESMTLKHRAESGPAGLSSVQQLALCALWFSQLGLLPNITLAHYKLTTIPPPHLASGVERGRGTLIMATQNSQFCHFFSVHRAEEGGCGHSKQLGERESGLERQSLPRHIRVHEENNGRRKRNQVKKQVGKLRRAFGIWRGGGG